MPVTRDTSEDRYRCSEDESDACREIRPTYFSAHFHVVQSHRKSGHLTARVLRIGSEEPDDAAVRETQAPPMAEEEAIEEEEIATPTPVLSAPRVSMAERAAGVRLSELVTEPEQPDDGDAALVTDFTPVTPTILRREQPINLPANLHAAYDAYRARGYTGAISDWATEIITNYFIISGLDIRLFDVSERERQKVMASAGLKEV